MWIEMRGQWVALIREGHEMNGLVRPRQGIGKHGGADAMG